MPINVTKTFLPPIEEYTSILKRAWDKAWITNNGELSQELEQQLKDYLGVRNLLFCTNGTVVLQLALKALDIKAEVITTPFSYVATTTAILWENCTPVFADVEPNTFCIDPAAIEAAITPRTQAILATHVYGYPCAVDAIEAIAAKRNLKVIYDGAHAFGTKISNRSLLDYGDISTCSFHATKLFHTGEGGCIVMNSDELKNRIYLHRHFGHIGDDYFSVGINGKNSEFHAAMGLCNLKYIASIMEMRKKQWLCYRQLLLKSGLQLLQIPNEIEYNYSYFPIVFPSEAHLLRAFSALKDKNIFARRYFYPSLNRLPYLQGASCPVAESIAQRIMCLPLYHDLSTADQELIVNTLMAVL